MHSSVQPSPGGRDRAAKVQKGREVYQSEALVTHLREKIAAGDYQEGERIGGEQELIKATGLSRATVREAIRLCCEQGLTWTRPGPKGGIFVARPSVGPLVRSLGVVLETSRVDLAHLFEARLELESTAARLAAERITEVELAHLRAVWREHSASVQKEPPDRELIAQWNMDFHAELVQASHNPVFVYLHSAVTELAMVSARISLFTRDVHLEGTGAHEKILDALEKRDADAAYRRVRRHLLAFEEALKTTNQYELLKQRFRI